MCLTETVNKERMDLGFATISRLRATFSPRYRLAGLKIKNDENLLGRGEIY